MFTAALFTIGEIRKQPQRSSLDGWMEKRWVTHTVEYYSAMK